MLANRKLAEEKRQARIRERERLESEALASQRDATSGERDATADERDATADERDATADERDATADERDAAADDDVQSQILGADSEMASDDD
jgi:hypothetical protein